MYTIRKVTTLLPALLALAVLVGCGFLEKVKDTVNALEQMKLVDNLEPSEQYYLGRGVSAVITDRFPIVEANDKRTEEQILYLNQLAGYIEASSQDVTRSALRLGDYTDRGHDAQQRVYDLALYKGLQVGILDTDEIAAFATPGGFLWISYGLIGMCSNEDELAAVVAHELAHIILDHGMENYRRAYKNSIFTSTLSETWFSGDSVGANFGRLCVTYAEDAFNGYQPSQEFEADSWGTRALAASGYAPRAMLTMLEQIDQYEKAHDIDPDEYLAHHPPVGERIKALQKLIQSDEVTVSGDSMTREGIESRGVRFNAVFK